MKRNIEIVWQAFSPKGEEPARKSFILDSDLEDLAIAELAFRDTNLYEGEIWTALQPLPENRSHTALSVNPVLNKGDLVIIDGLEYEVAMIGFTLVSENPSRESR